MRVEIADYLQKARRHLLVLMGVPVLATVLSASYVATSPRPYVASLYVAPPSLMGSQFGTYQGAAGATQFANDFIATATSPAAEDAVASRTGVSVGDIHGGLSVQQVGLSSRVKVTYTSRQAPAARLVAVAVARYSLTSMFGVRVPSARAAVRSATATLHRANQALAAFQGAADSGEHADLVARRTAAANTLTTTEQVLAQAQAQLAAADPRQVVAPPAQQVSMSHLVVSMVLPAFALGVFLAIVLVVLLELVAQQRPARGRERLLVGRFSATTSTAERDETSGEGELERLRLEAAE